MPSKPPTTRPPKTAPLPDSVVRGVLAYPGSDYSEIRHTFDFDFGGAFRFGLGVGMGCVFALPAAIILTFIVLSVLGISLNALMS